MGQLYVSFENIFLLVSFVYKTHLNAIYGTEYVYLRLYNKLRIICKLNKLILLSENRKTGRQLKGRPS